MFQVASGKLFSLAENTRAETLSWHTYIRYLNIEKKKKNLLIVFFFNIITIIILLCFMIHLKLWCFVYINFIIYITNKTLKKLT